jgi:hypothetical protein
MLVPLSQTHIQGVRRVFALALAGLAVAAFAIHSPAAFAARGPEPARRIDLAPLGYEPVQERYLLAGGTMFTVNYADASHLLVTWTARGLLKRMPDAQPDDEDRNIEMVLLELPSGKVLARTALLVRDHATFLWPLGKGAFLLRVRNEFSVIEPLRNLAQAKPFEAHTVLRSQRPVAFVFVSPEAEVLTLETFPPRPPKSELNGQDIDRTHAPVQINFYRVARDPEDRLVMQAAGVVRSDYAVALPLTGAGYLEAIKDSNRTYFFDFVPNTGKRLELAAFDTTCYPRVSFVTRSEFISFGCRGADERQEMGYFNLRGEYRWVSAFSNQHVNPTLASAPAAGRFALGRTLVNGAGLGQLSLTDAEVTGQELTAYQAHDGRVLLKLMATPVQRAGQNFDISPDGLSMAIFHDVVIEVYPLPPLTAKDQQEVAAAAKLALPSSGGMVRVTSQQASDDAEAGEASSAPVTMPLPSVTQPSTSASAIQWGDPVYSPGAEEVPRKAPSLYDEDHPKSAEH